MKVVGANTVNINTPRIGALILCCVTGQVGVVVGRQDGRNLLAWVDDPKPKIYIDDVGYRGLAVIEVVP